MLRFATIAAAVLLSVSHALAHESESAPPPPRRGPQEAPAQVISTSHGIMLVDLKGMTLYYFDRDDSGNKSNCDAACTQRWTPLAAPADAQAYGDFTIIMRNDGSRMWAYRYRPLYTSATDKAPGDANGADATTLWHIARPTY
jgi:predicted lipoprotein with Yx(FWY)xxD motif